MANPANDHFVRYFSEKLWEWIPAIYRTEDGLAEPPSKRHVLRALVQVIAEQAAIAGCNRSPIPRGYDRHV